MVQSVSLTGVSHAGDRKHLKSCHKLTPNRLDHMLVITPDLCTHCRLSITKQSPGEKDFGVAWSQPCHSEQMITSVPMLPHL